VREKAYDTIMAAGDPPLAALADLYDELQPLLPVGCPPPTSVRRVLDKALTLETARQCGIPIPFTCTVASAEDLLAVAPRLRFPLIAKPMKKGAASFRILYFHNLQELSASLTANAWGPILLQEYCPGVGVGVEVLIHKGECLAKFQHRRLKEAPATGGVAVLAIAEEPDPELLQRSMTLLRALGWEGVAMVEYRFDRESGKSVLMEVNGRFWGSLSFPIAAGINFPYYYWQVLRGERPNVPDRYRVGMRWRWTPGYFDRMQSILFSRGGIGPMPSVASELLGAVADLSPLTKEAVWSWSDPLPFAAETYRMAKSLVANLFKAVFRKIVPLNLRRESDLYSRTIPQARSRYVSLRLRQAVGFPSNNGNSVDCESIHSVLFVCYGNLMRSPMAEVMLKRFLADAGIDDIVVESAGVHAVPGREAHTMALAVSRELGIPLDVHRSQPITPGLISRADLILAMDLQNLAELEILYPEARQKIFLLSTFVSDPERNREIPDPYQGNIETTRRCFSVLRFYVQNLASRINASHHKKEASVER
jgi:protein-tyrosine-phosphatase/glutathione synthase/RimK-type ligase-like ATP-grasp enzyme